MPCRLCVWRLSAPAGHSLLLEFDHLDLENDSSCQYDRLTVLVGTNRPVGKQAAWKYCTLKTTLGNTNKTKPAEHLQTVIFFNWLPPFTGIFCGSVPPGPVLLNNSQDATLLFSSDTSQAGSGFVVRHRALRGHAATGGKPRATKITNLLVSKCHSGFVLFSLFFKISVETQ